jgi:hypothetical protein
MPDMYADLKKNMKGAPLTREELTAKKRVLSP